MEEAFNLMGSELAWSSRQRYVTDDQQDERSDSTGCMHCGGLCECYEYYQANDQATESRPQVLEEWDRRGAKSVYLAEPTIAVNNVVDDQSHTFHFMERRDDHPASKDPVTHDWLLTYAAYFRLGSHECTMLRPAHPTWNDMRGFDNARLGHRS